MKKKLKIALKISLRKIKKLKPLQIIAIVLILGLGIFNGVTGIAPQIKQHSRESNIVKTFNRWWKDTGAQEFKAVGLEPSKELKAEEFQRYREKYLQQNPSYIIEERVESMKKDYLEWWENQGGRQAFLQENGRYPDDADYQRSLDSWLNKFKNKFVRYSFAFIPEQALYERVLTSWMLFPGVLSFLIFAGFFFFAITQLQKRWPLWITLGTTVLFTLGAPVLVGVLAETSFFDHYAGERYMGMSLTVAFLLGAAAFGPKKLEVSQKITAIAIAGLLADMIINWFANPGLYGAVAILSPVCFGIGTAAGLKIETKRKTREELNAEVLEQKLQEAPKNPIAERKAKTRALIADGFASAKDGAQEKAQQQLGQALTLLLQEHPVDVNLVKDTAARMTSPSLYLEFSSNQWMEWGEIAKAKNAPEAAVYLLKKCLSTEKDKNFARRALFVLGDICIHNKIETQDGINRLQKVIEMNGSDMLAMQAKKMLEAQGATIKSAPKLEKAPDSISAESQDR